MSDPEEVNYRHRGNRLVILSRSDPIFSHLKRRFKRSWLHPKEKKPRPSVRAIYEIVLSQECLQPYIQYRERVAGSSIFDFIWKPGANEKLLFHGTTRACLLGEDTQNVYLCNDAGCSLCNIIHNSFDINRCGLNSTFKRFGTGIYVTSCSSKADGYSRNISGNMPLRAMLLNWVVVGKSYKRRHNATNMTEPPTGYDSVVGKPGARLNYEETVVYNNDAIRPAYLIVYGDKPVSKK